MTNYTIYGITLSSDIPLPELTPVSGDPDIYLKFGEIRTPWRRNFLRRRSFAKTSDGVLLAWDGFARFLIRDGNEIILEKARRAEESVIRQLLIGPVLAVALNLRGFHIFHASVVSIAQGGAAFLGFKGQGKSTLVQAFSQLDHPILSDDLLVLKTVDSQLMVFPGAPFIKLWPESMSAAGLDPKDHPKFKKDVDKRVLTMTEQFGAGAVPIRALFVLDNGEEIGILPLDKKEALLRLIPHWYGSLYNRELIPLLGIDRQFRDCASLVENTPVYLLKRPRSLDLVPETCRQIEWHLENTALKNS